MVYFEEGRSHGRDQSYRIYSWTIIRGVDSIFQMNDSERRNVPHIYLNQEWLRSNGSQV